MSIKTSVTTRIMVRRKGTADNWQPLSGLTEQPAGIDAAMKMIDTASPAMAKTFDFAISYTVEYLLDYNPPTPEEP